MLPVHQYFTLKPLASAPQPHQATVTTTAKSDHITIYNTSLTGCCHHIISCDDNLRSTTSNLDNTKIIKIRPSTIYEEGITLALTTTAGVLTTSPIINNQRYDWICHHIISCDDITAVSDHITLDNTSITFAWKPLHHRYERVC